MKNDNCHACICGQWVAEDHAECRAMKLDMTQAEAEEQDEREFESEWADIHLPND